MASASPPTLASASSNADPVNAPPSCSKLDSPRPSSKMSDGYNWCHLIQTHPGTSCQVRMGFSYAFDDLFRRVGILESDWGRGVSGVMDGCCWKDWGAHQAVRLPHRSRTFRQNPMQSKTRRRRRTVFSSFLPSSESLHLVDLCGNARFKTSAFQHVSWIN